MLSAVFAWLHLLAAGAAAGLLVAGHWLLKRPLDRLQARLLGLADLGWLLALIATLATGLARLPYFSRGPAQYLDNHLFLLKLGLTALLFVVAASVTRRVVAWGRAARSGRGFAPTSVELDQVRAALTLELGLVAVVTFLAVLVARGYG